MKKILTKLDNWKFVILIIIIVVGYFYWYQIRPSSIDTYCNKSAVVSAQKEYSSLPSNTRYERDQYEHYYKVCLRSKGINK